MGSNMAECHPVGFQWVMEAKKRGARVIHVDPRFTRTSAMATDHVPLRAGSDIAFLGGIVNYILEHGREFREYVVNYTNAPVIVDEGFRDTEELDGLFSGWDADKGTYDTTTWQYAGMEVHGAAGQREQGATQGEASGHGAHGARSSTVSRPRWTRRSSTRAACSSCCAATSPATRRRWSRRSAACRGDQFIEVAEALCENSGRERTSAFCYAVGWTQHTVGVQYIRTAAIVQLLLGNIGRPGGGILALRGHASIQGSTDIPTLYNILPGYIPMPHAQAHAGPRGVPRAEHVAERLLGPHGRLHGEPAEGLVGRRSHRRERVLLRLPAAHHRRPLGLRTVLRMLDGKVKGYLVLGENPAVGSANSGLHRKAMAKLDWLVVRDFVEIETAAFWYDSPEVQRGELRTEDIATEVFLMPAAAHTEKDGTFTNTQRLLQWHHKAVEPPGDCRSELWFTYHLGRIIREKLAGSTDERDRPLLDLTWHYPTAGEIADPERRGRAARDQRHRRRTARRSRPTPS